MLLLYREWIREIRSYMLIYIPLCFYFIKKNGDISKDSIPIYIPLCFYFIAEAVPDKYIPLIHLHSTMLLLYLINFAKRAYLISIYIPLCFYFIERCEAGREREDNNLHSTMLLLYRVLVYQMIFESSYLHSTMLLLYPSVLQGK